MNGMNEGNDSTISSACELCTLVKRKLLPITFKVYAEKAYDFFSWFCFTLVCAPARWNVWYEKRTSNDMTIYVKAERLQAKWQRKEGKGRDHLGSNECALLRMVCLGERALEAGNFHCAQTIAIHYELDNMVFLNYRCCDCACSRRDAENTYKRETIHNFIEIGWVFFIGLPGSTHTDTQWIKYSPKTAPMRRANKQNITTPTTTISLWSICLTYTSTVVDEQQN